jgi:hypothetical protein
MSLVRASIYQIEDNQTYKNPLDVWISLAEKLKKYAPSVYNFDSSRRYSIIVLTKCMTSPCKTLTRYRTVSLTIRIKPNFHTLIELSARNLFRKEGRPLSERVDQNEYPNLRVWINKVQKVSLKENIEIIEKFIADSNNCGCQIKKTELSILKFAPPKIRTNRGEITFPVEKPSQLFNKIYSWPKYTKFTISTLIEKEARIDENIIRRARQELTTLFGGSCNFDLEHRVKPERDALNLIVIPTRIDLNEHKRAKVILRACESSGYLFKFTQLDSLNDEWSLKTQLSDLINIGGGRFWEPVTPSVGFFAIDAGHNTKLKKTRWTKVETDPQLNIIEIATFDSEKAEHVPNRLHNSLWPKQEKAILCRDGRFSKERPKYIDRCKKENRAYLEVKKNPSSILWREGDRQNYSSIFGDAVVDIHGEITIQSCTQKEDDYGTPLRLDIGEGDPSFIINEFLNQLCLQSLARFTVGRLHGALYYADLASKLTEGGWTRVIGRGYGLIKVIPE